MRSSGVLERSFIPPRVPAQAEGNPAPVRQVDAAVHGQPAQLLCAQLHGHAVQLELVRLHVHKRVALPRGVRHRARCCCAESKRAQPGGTREHDMRLLSAYRTRTVSAEY